MSRMPDGRNPVRFDESVIMDRAARLAGALTRWLDAAQRGNQNLRNVITLAMQAFIPVEGFAGATLEAAMRAAGLPPDPGAEDRELEFACTALGDAAIAVSVGLTPQVVMCLDRLESLIPEEFAIQPS